MKKTPTALPGCPCGGPAFETCCGPYLAGPSEPPDALALMRSRYSAYVRRDREHLLRTWHPDTRPEAFEVPDPAVQWLGLDVRQHEQQDADHATVEFVARSKLGGRAHRSHERSRFVREGGRWFYVDGEFPSGD